MTFEEAIKIAIRKYYEGEDPVELLSAQEGQMKYTREYFDELEEELMSPKKGKKKKEKIEEFEEEFLDDERD